MFGLLGPNGTGKSTLMQILATLQESDTGVAIFNNIDILKEKDKLRKTLGYLPQESRQSQKKLEAKRFSLVEILVPPSVQIPFCQRFKSQIKMV